MSAQPYPAGGLRVRWWWRVQLLFGRAGIYGVLLTAVGCVYVFGVVRTDALFGLDSDWLAAPQVAAAGLVALVFHPVLRWVEHRVDRLVYGRRMAPYEVLASVAALVRSSGTGTQALDALARITAEGLGTGHAAVHLYRPDGATLVRSWPPDAGSPANPRLLPVAFRGVGLGALAVPGGPGARLPAARRAMLEQLVAGAGVILHNAALFLDLEHRLAAAAQRAADIRASRWRIVAAQDSERRELERDLHDGAQPSLTAVRLSLGLAAHLARGGDPAATREALLRLQRQIHDAAASLRRVLHGLDPPALSRDGIAAALVELAESLGSQADVTATPQTASLRFPADIEAAVYFCCAEALQNAVKHCPWAPVQVQLAFDPAAGALNFAVTDNGPGFDVSAAPDSGGLRNMADRIAAVGGALDITSSPTGTTVSGSVPTPPLSPSRGG